MFPLMVSVILNIQYAVILSFQGCKYCTNAVKSGLTRQMSTLEMGRDGLLGSLAPNGNSASAGTARFWLHFFGVAVEGQAQRRVVCLYPVI